MQRGHEAGWAESGEGMMGCRERSVQEAQEAARWCPARNSNYYPVWTSLLPATVLCTHSCQHSV